MPVPSSSKYNVKFTTVLNVIGNFIRRNKTIWIVSLPLYLKVKFVFIKIGLYIKLSIAS